MPMSAHAHSRKANGIVLSRAALACLLAIMPAGCASAPGEYAATLSRQDSKWQSPQCVKARADASRYTSSEPRVSWAAGLLLGPYGLGLAAAGKEHVQKQRKLYAREVHLQCSSQPLPKALT